jgi:hypothetical protein
LRVDTSTTRRLSFQAVKDALMVTQAGGRPTSVVAQGHRAIDAGGTQQGDGDGERRK